MNTHLVVTATGPDQPGVVERIAEQLVALKGNVEASRMARLGGEFASILLVSVAEDSAERLQRKLKDLETDGYTVTTRVTREQHSDRYAGYLPYEIRVEGADHPGIIHSVAHSLASRGVNIESMETAVHQAPMSGGPLVTMVAVVYAPGSVPREELREALDRLGDDLGVSTRLSSFAG